MRFAIYILFLFISTCSFAQMPLHHAFSNAEYTLLKQAADSNKLNRPQKATLLSAVLPGAGQIYNKKYWKAGLVYAGAAGLIYMYKSNIDSMRSYQQAYVQRQDGDSATIDTKYALLTDAAVKSYRDYHRRLKDISILGFFGLYALQIIDANVDAHLYEFKVNEDLSLRWQPEIRPMSMGNTSYHGIKLSIRF